jgi:preprotein translocase subunit SecG
MSILLTVLHVGVAISLILFVLLQAGKGAGIGAAFGGSSETLFGASGPQSFMSKLTAGAAILFMVTSLLLSFFGARSQTRSIVPAAPLRPQPQSSAPAKPGTPAAPQSQESAKPEAK